MMPDPSMGLTTQRPEISVLRADTPIMAFKPYTDDEEQKIGNELSKQLDIKAGGVAGIASTTSRAVIALEKTCFRPGESININIDIDMDIKWSSLLFICFLCCKRFFYCSADERDVRSDYLHKSGPYDLLVL